MDIIYVLLLLIIVFLLVGIRNSLHSRTDDLESRINELQRLVKKITVSQLASETEPPKTVGQTPVVKCDEAASSVAAPTEVPSRRVIDKPVKETHVERPVPRFEAPDYRHRQPEPELSFFERYPDLEKFIGENLVNKIGIAILVLAIAFFVKYAIDNDWVGPVGRVGIGVLCGGILIGIAHRLRNSYKAFSSVLVGGGLAVLYFTITLAYHQFHLFDQTVSFIILICITCFAVALSLLYDKQELAVIALVGGLSSPFMVSSGQANYNALFIYLIVLNTGLLIIAYYKSWRILNITAFALTVIITGGVVYSLADKSYSTGLIYCSILYLLFFAINVANNVRENKKFIAADFTILLACNTLYFSVGLYLLGAMKMQHLQGLFCAGLGFVNLVLSFLLFRNRKVDNNILYLLIGITLTFISLIAPIQLHGHAITLFWAAEVVLLYWLYQRSKIKLMGLAALLVWIVMLLSLSMDWLALYGWEPHQLPVIANKGFITSFAAAVSSYLLYYLMQRDEENTIYGFAVPVPLYKILAFVLLFMAGLLEVNLQFSTRYPDTDLNVLYLMLYVPAFVYILYAVSKRISSLTLNWLIATVLLSICIIIELLFSGLIFQIQADMLTGNTISHRHFIAQWVSVIFVMMIFYELIRLVRYNLSGVAVAAWVTSAAIMIFLSLNVCLAITAIFYTPATTIDALQTVYVKVGLPILWGALSFIMIWLGMRYKARALRIISLTLFSITLIKLFVFDIRNIPPAGKIAAFFCLGVLLLIVSFMYQNKLLSKMESRMKSKIAGLTLIMAFCVSSLFAQYNFKYKASLGKIDSSRMYKIYLSPDIIAKLETSNEDDFRVRGKNGELVSFIYSDLIPTRPHMVMLPKLTKYDESNPLTLAVFENSSSSVLDHIDLKIRNTDVARNISLSGSDDLKNWYAIADDKEVERATYNDNEDGTFTHKISFPASNYKYFKVEQGDKKLKPISVMSGSFIIREPSSKRYDQVTVKNISQRDSGGMSIVNILLKNKYRLSKLNLVCEGAKYYRRDIAIYGYEENGRTQLFNGYISSEDKSPEVTFASSTDRIEVIVQNGDSPPLKVKAVAILQAVPVIASYLEKGGEYELVFGDPKSGPAAWDMQWFADSLFMQPMPEIIPKKIELNPLYKNSQADSFKLPKWVIWVAMGIAALLLLALTLKMTQEVNKRAKTNE